ncbi:hypothetical protein KKG51_02300, partial [Patescibacteria group bacterium]|nr:hypothetical protein [Patescibacteria group bacterium]
MKTKIKIVIIILALLAGLILISHKSPPPVIDESKIRNTYFINYPEEFNYRQTINDCGPFNTAAVVRALKDEKVDSFKFAEKIEWRLSNKYTLPWGLEKQLKENGIVIETPNLQAFSEKEKILFLQEQLSLNKPMIILGGRDSYQHYMTIFGFDSTKNEFYVYDSLQEKNKNDESLTLDKNQELPGNTTLNS